MWLRLKEHTPPFDIFQILASLFVLSVAEAQWFNPNWQSGMMPYRPYMNNFYNNHHMYKREADSEAEPKADAWMPGFYSGKWQNQMSYMPYMGWYGQYPYNFNYNRFYHY